MLTFRQYITEMESSVPVNCAGDASTVGDRLAGLDNNPPGKAKNLTKKILKRLTPKI